MPQLTATRLQGCSGAFRQRVSRNAFAKSCLPCTSARMPRLGLFKTNRSSWQELCHFCIQYQGYGTFRGQQHCCGTRRVQLVQLVSMFGLCVWMMWEAGGHTVDCFMMSWTLNMMAHQRQSTIMLEDGVGGGSFMRFCYSNQRFLSMTLQLFLSCNFGASACAGAENILTEALCHSRWTNTWQQPASLSAERGET